MILKLPLGSVAAVQNVFDAASLPMALEGLTRVVVLESLSQPLLIFGIFDCNLGADPKLSACRVLEMQAEAWERVCRCLGRFLNK